MAESDCGFAGSIPGIYDAYLVPLIFEAYAEDLAGRVAALAPQRVLETAAGTGVVPRALAPRLAADARYVVTDINPPMLEHAKARQGADGRITWRQADALDLPFADAAFDAVVCQFGAMFFPDKVAGFAAARRVLRPGGTFFCSVWDEIGANDFAQAVTLAAAAEFPDDPPRFLARVPHGYHDVARLRDDLGAAGFAQVAVTTLAKVSTAPSPRHPAIAYCQGTPLRSEIEARGAGLLDAGLLDAGLLERVTDRAAAAIARQFGDGPVSGGPVSGGPVSGGLRGHIVAAVR